MMTDMQDRNANAPDTATQTVLTIIMPAYNEQEAIEEAVADVRDNVLDKIPGSKLLVVNDGSKDRTGELLDAMHAQDDRVCVHHKKNGGHGPAIMTGLDNAESDYVFLVDSDLQMPLEPFDKLWNVVANEGKDGAFGVRPDSALNGFVKMGRRMS